MGHDFLDIQYDVGNGDEWERNKMQKEMDTRERRRGISEKEQKDATKSWVRKREKDLRKE